MIQSVGLIPLFPLVGFLVIALGRNRLSKSLSGIIGTTAIAASFVVSVSVFFSLGVEPVTVKLFHWFSAGTLSVDFSFLVDHLSAIMLLVVTGVGLLIHIYSLGYMHDDDGFGRFFSYLNLFVFFMLLLVLGANYLVLFVGWEGVGLCSYLLIGFWFKNQEYNKAANKAFIMNRIGDLAFLLGVIMLFFQFGSVAFSDVLPIAATMADNQPAVIAITILLFIGATGKSAQIPLFTWLPDAMAGPTPVSALIHAATMVTAGIYMVVRSNILFSIAPFTLEIIAYVGAFTALMAAAIAIGQTDIKKVLAYSTVSQLGFMVAALGVGAYVSSLFHVVTHAFFKALLFLAAGSVIHAMSGEQDVRKMGGLRKKLPITYLVFLIGTLAISGIPPFAGFFSKDEILAHVWTQNKLLFVVLSITAIMTTVYMFRLFFMTFFGSFRGSQEQEHHLHESPSSMTAPLIVLAVLSTLGGFLGIPEIFGGKHFLNGYLDSLMSSPGAFSGQHISHSTEWALMIATLTAIGAAVYWTHRSVVVSGNVTSSDESYFSPSFRLLNKKLLIDEFYQNTIVRPIRAIGFLFNRIIEPVVIDGTVKLINTGVHLVSDGSRRIQTGNVGFYIFATVFGALVVLFYNLIAR